MQGSGWGNTDSIYMTDRGWLATPTLSGATRSRRRAISVLVAKSLTHQGLPIPVVSMRTQRETCTVIDIPRL